MTIRRIVVLLLAVSLACCSDLGTAPSRSDEENVILELIFRDLMSRVPPRYQGHIEVYFLSVLIPNQLSDPSPTVLRKFLNYIPPVKGISASYVDSSGYIYRDRVTGSLGLLFSCTYSRWLDADHVYAVGELKSIYWYEYTLSRVFSGWKITRVTYFLPQ
jgi:hypothetical protein